MRTYHSSWAHYLFEAELVQSGSLAKSQTLTCSAAYTAFRHLGQTEVPVNGCMVAVRERGCMQDETRRRNQAPEVSGDTTAISRRFKLGTVDPLNHRAEKFLDLPPPPL